MAFLFSIASSLSVDSVGSCFIRDQQWWVTQLECDPPVIVPWGSSSGGWAVRLCYQRGKKKAAGFSCESSSCREWPVWDLEQKGCLTWEGGLAEEDAGTLLTLRRYLCVVLAGYDTSLKASVGYVGATFACYIKGTNLFGIFSTWFDNT